MTLVTAAMLWSLNWIAYPLIKSEMPGDCPLDLPEEIMPPACPPLSSYDPNPLPSDNYVIVAQCAIDHGKWIQVGRVSATRNTVDFELDVPETSTLCCRLRSIRKTDKAASKWSDEACHSGSQAPGPMHRPHLLHCPTLNGKPVDVFHDCSGADNIL